MHSVWPPFVFWCFATAMLTFFEPWPAFHICAGQAVLFALTIMGDPQLLFRTLEEPLKCPRRSIALRCTAETQPSRDSVSRVQLCWASVKLLCSDCVETTSAGPNQISVFTHSKDAISSMKSPRFSYQLPSSCHCVFPDFTHGSHLCLWTISQLFCAPLTKACFTSTLADQQRHQTRVPVLTKTLV